jgi:rubredoxin
MGVEMLDDVRDAATDEGDYVDFLTAGTPAAGEYHCSECGYGVTVHAALPACPMCAGESWESVPWSPLSRALELQ